MTEQDAYQKLEAGLREEVRLLGSIVDASTAKATLPALKKTMEELQSLNTQIDEQQLWRYIENTPAVKQPLIDHVERLFLELQRLEKNRCYSYKPLESLLKPMLIPAA